MAVRRGLAALSLVGLLALSACGETDESASAPAASNTERLDAGRAPGEITPIAADGHLLMDAYVFGGRNGVAACTHVNTMALLGSCNGYTPIVAGLSRSDVSRVVEITEHVGGNWSSDAPVTFMVQVSGWGTYGRALVVDEIVGPAPSIRTVVVADDRDATPSAVISDDDPARREATIDGTPVSVTSDRATRGLTARGVHVLGFEYSSADQTFRVLLLAGDEQAINSVRHVSDGVPVVVESWLRSHRSSDLSLEDAAQRYVEDPP